MAEQRILIADDDYDVRTISKIVLESEGFEVIEAGDGSEVVERAREHRPDLIFLDLMMPDTDGWDAIDALRADERTEGIPVVAVTASDPSVDDIRNAGFCALLTKPVSAFDMIRAIGICIDARAHGRLWVRDLARELAQR